MESSLNRFTLLFLGIGASLWVLYFAIPKVLANFEPNNRRNTSRNTFISMAAVVLVDGGGQVVASDGTLGLAVPGFAVLAALYKFLYGSTLGMALAMSLLVTLILVVFKLVFMMAAAFLWSIHPVACAAAITLVVAVPFLLAWQRHQLQKRFLSVDDA